MILQSEPRDSGFYQCIVQNEAGFEMAFARIEVIVQGMYYRLSYKVGFRGWLGDNFSYLSVKTYIVTPH